MINLRDETWLIGRLGQHGAAVLTGLTDIDIRRQRVRDAILGNGFECIVVSGADRKPETYAQAFERIYAEPLTPSTRKPRASKPVTLGDPR